MSWGLDAKVASLLPRCPKLRLEYCDLVLPPRLAQVVSMVPKESGVLDIGTDHGLVLVALSEANAQRKLIGGDINSAPLGGAASRLAEYGLTESIELRLGDGADVLRDGEVECLVMAGIGGRTMANILNRRDLSKLGVADLVLQPNRHEPELRIALANKGWEIQEEEVVLEGVKAYVVMHWQFKGEVADYDTMDYWLGPKLKRNRGPLCLAMVDYWCLHYGAIVNAKEGSGEDIQALKEGLASLRKWLALSLP